MKISIPFVPDSKISKVWSSEKRPNFQFNQDKGLAWKPAKADVASLQILLLILKYLFMLWGQHKTLHEIQLVGICWS